MFFEFFQVLVTLYWLGRTANNSTSYSGATLNLKEFEGLLTQMRKVFFAALRIETSFALRMCIASSHGGLHSNRLYLGRRLLLRFEKHMDDGQWNSV